MRKVRTILMTAIIVGISGHATAGTIYKCVNSEGAAIYKDSICEKDEKLIETKGIQSPKKLEVTSLDCFERQAEAPAINSCLEEWKKILRDPRSAYAETGTVIYNSKTKDRSILIDGHAANGFGGMNNIQMQCGLTESNLVDSSTTSRFIEYYQALKGLNVEPTRRVPEICK